MTDFRFSVGERVRFANADGLVLPRNPFEIVSRHGADGVEPSYRVRDLKEGTARMASESMICPASRRRAAPQADPR